MAFKAGRFQPADLDEERDDATGGYASLRNFIPTTETDTAYDVDPLSTFSTVPHVDMTSKDFVRKTMKKYREEGATLCKKYSDKISEIDLKHKLQNSCFDIDSMEDGDVNGSGN